jgi:hypothetical protein
MKKNTIFCCLALISIFNSSMFAQFNTTEKIEIINAFNDDISPTYFMDCGANEQDIIRRYFKNSIGFSVHFYSQKKELVVQRCNFIISILNEPFFELNKRFNKEYREILGERYEETIERLKNGDRFYFLQKGTVNKLILCGQDLQDISYLLSIFSPTFQPDSKDIDNEGLPDYYEKQIGTDPNNHDSDGDGLSDFDEVFKYRLNPLSKDTDGDGIPDNYWDERREFTYTIKTVREIYPPYDISTMNDFFQDTKVINHKKDTLLFESILYPNAVNFIIPLTKKSEVFPKDISKYTMPSFFCNYTPEISTELINLVETWKVANNYELLQLFAKYIIIITTGYPSNEPLNFYINVVNGKVDIVYPYRFDAFKTEHFTTNESVLDHLTFGESMYKNRMRGACSSSSIFYNTLLRAINFPTRIITSNPIVNYQDDLQVKLIENLKNEKYRNIALSQRDRLKWGYANHFFYEVYINGRWIRCDYDNVNINCVHNEGLFTVQDKFMDYSERDFAHTWGKRMVENLGNAYKTLELSDQFPLNYK